MKKIYKNQSGISHMVALLVVVVIAAVGGTGYYVFRAQDTSQNSEKVTSQSASQAQTLGDISGIKSAAEIAALASGGLGDKTIKSIELETEDSGLVYKVKLSDRSVLVYDAMTGRQLTSKVLSSDDGFDDSDDSLPASVSAAVTVDAARATAVAAYPNVAVKKIELEIEEGVLVYSVRFVDDARVDVNAQSGEIVRTKDLSGASNDSSSGSSSGGSSGSSSGSSGGSSPGSSSGGSDDSSSTSSGGNSGSTATAISEAQARSIASNRLPGRTIEKVENEVEEGVAVFSVRFTDDGRVDVRKSDGAITRVKE